MKKIPILTLVVAISALLVMPVASASGNIDMDTDLPDQLTAGNSYEASITVVNNLEGGTDVQAYLEINPDDGGVKIFKDGEKITADSEGRYILGNLNLPCRCSETIDFKIKTDIRAEGDYSLKIVAEGQGQKPEEKEPEEPEEPQPPKPPQQPKDEDEKDYQIPSGSGTREEPEEETSGFPLFIVALLAVALAILAIALGKKKKDSDQEQGPQSPKGF